MLLQLGCSNGTSNTRHVGRVIAVNGPTGVKGGREMRFQDILQVLWPQGFVRLQSSSDHVCLISFVYVLMCLKLQ